MVRISFILLLLTTSFANAQPPRLVGAPCEGCEAVLNFLKIHLDYRDTLPEFENTEPKLKIQGTVFKSDGKTPAEGVILYVYHTNRDGIYPTKGNETGWDNKHGYLQGWMKTDTQGKYEFYTFRPEPYPSATGPAHIHLTILEPNGKYYWLASYVFADDPLNNKKEVNPRGGKGENLTLKKKGNLYHGQRDIILGKNVHNYD